MSADRELLELAARAAGYQIEWNDWRDCGGWTDYRKIPGGYWNPLINDGDALRLAVKLNITIQIDSVDAVAIRSGSIVGQREFMESDPCAATRRAIVRAAAEIGREEP